MRTYGHTLMVWTYCINRPSLIDLHSRLDIFCTADFTSDTLDHYGDYVHSPVICSFVSWVRY